MSGPKAGKNIDRVGRRAKGYSMFAWYSFSNKSRVLERLWALSPASRKAPTNITAIAIVSGYKISHIDHVAVFLTPHHFCACSSNGVVS